MEDRHVLLRTELAAQLIELRITPNVLVDDRASGAGLVDSFMVTIVRSDQEPIDLIGTLFRPVPEMHARHGLTRGTGSFAIPVDSDDEAQSEAKRYDPVPVFADHIAGLWRGSMSPWEFYPDEAPGGAPASYAHYRQAMLRDGRFRTLISLARELGESAYERLEAAALDDIGVRAGNLVQESRFQYLRGLLLPDPSTNVADAIRAKFVPDLLAKHRVDDWDRLGCPYCERFYPREELAIVSYSEPAAGFAGVAWGCVDCTGGFAIDIPLDRIQTMIDAMRWTVHMLSKDWMQHPVAVRGWIASLAGIFGDECDLRPTGGP